jgi:hypothetical protein
MDCVLLGVGDTFRLITVEPPDAALAVLAGAAHVGAVHAAGRALPASATHGEDRVVAGLHARDGCADGGHSAEHFVSHHEVGLALRRERTAAGRLLAIGAADAHAHHVHPDVVGPGDGRLRAIDPSHGRAPGDDGYCFHEEGAHAARMTSAIMPAPAPSPTLRKKFGETGRRGVRVPD